MHRQDLAGLREALPVLKSILHSDALTEIVRGTKPPGDEWTVMADGTGEADSEEAAIAQRKAPSVP